MSIKVATILPVKHLELTKDNPYHMVLAQFVGESQEYTEFFMGRRDAGKFVLMDNGAAEGCQPTMEELIPKIQLLEPTEIVLPDTPMNSKVTLHKGRKALEVVYANFDPKVYLPRLMAVPQGATIQDWVDCARAMLKWPIQAFGVSKFLTSNIGDNARTVVLERLYEQCSASERAKLAETDIHFLGCHIHPKETAGALHLEGKYKLRGTDSAIAFIYTQAGVEITHGTTRPEGEIDFMGGEAKNVALLKKNIKKWEDFSNGLL